MKSTSSKIVSSLLTIAFLGFFVTPAFAAVECDKDGDGYIVIPNPVMKVVAPNVTYDENGTYSSVQWQDFFKMFTTAQLTEDDLLAFVLSDEYARFRRALTTRLS